MYVCRTCIIFGVEVGDQFCVQIKKKCPCALFVCVCVCVIVVYFLFNCLFISF